ncbi:MAG: hypothetical protein AAFQ83_13865 [Bacteroidota bacterium]
MKKPILRTLSFLIQLILMLVLPFFILIKGSTWLYQSYDWPWWGAVATMLLLDFLLLLIYVAMLYDWIRGPGKMSKGSIKLKAIVVIGLMGLFIGYTVFNLSGANAKGEEVRKEYSTLHPLLRVAVGTMILFNQNILVTDMARGHQDYKKMGLKSKKHSLHYPQSDGFVHAMDLRTKGYSETRNELLGFYFKILGFNTLRHVGTADHLHISLSSKDRPGAI